MSPTLVPSFDHLANADLCNKRAIPNQRNTISGFRRWAETHRHTGLGWNQTSFRRGVSPHNEW